MAQLDYMTNALRGSAAEFLTNAHPTIPVNLYTTPTDARSAKTRAWLEAHNIPFTERNIIADPEALRQMITLSGSRRVPVVQIGDQILVGFDEYQLAASLPEMGGVPIETPSMGYARWAGDVQHGGDDGHLR